MRRAKLAVLVASLAWLAALGAYAAATMDRPLALAGYTLILLVPLAAAGWAGFGRGLVRGAAAAFVVAFGYWVANATFSDMRLMVGIVGVLVSILMPTRYQQSTAREHAMAR